MTGEQDAQAVYDSLPDWHPSLVVDAFRMGLEEGVPHEVLAAFVTPESLPSWGDFTRARAAFATGLRISMNPQFTPDAPDVVAVRLVETDQHTVRSTVGVPATMHATLVWRPELPPIGDSCWRIHHLGQQGDVAEVPRSAPGFDPRTEL